MSTAFYIVFEREIPECDSFVDGKSLAREAETLDGFARELGVTPIMEFFSQNLEDAADLLAEFDTDSDAGGIDLPEERWFPAEDGLRTIQALLDYVAAHPGSVVGVDSVLRDLEDFRRLLSKAAEAGVAWHMVVDF